MELGSGTVVAEPPKEILALSNFTNGPFSKHLASEHHRASADKSPSDPLQWVLTLAVCFVAAAGLVLLIVAVH